MGPVRGEQVRVVDFDVPEANDWLVVNQFTVVENKHERRPDIVLFVNGLPLGVIELKNPADENETVFQQLQTYKAEIPSLFAFNAALVVSDGLEARIGALTATWEWFKPWRTITGEGYHQFHAVESAVAETLRAARLRQGVASRPERDRSGRQPGGTPGDRRIGVVWHTQGSGKSLTMAFYAGRLVCDPAMENPTVVVLTDRNDLDDQLFATFARCADLLRQPPAQAENRADLRAKLAVQAGSVVFTTIQKFFPDEKGDRHPLLSERRNIEAPRKSDGVSELGTRESGLHRVAVFFPGQ